MEKTEEKLRKWSLPSTAIIMHVKTRHRNKSLE